MRYSVSLSNWRWYRKWKGGIWYYVRPYDNLYHFTHMRYWINRNPLYNEVVLGHEVHQTNQRTFIFCDECGIEMISNKYCVKDEEVVHFDCVRCGNKSEYNFDIAPVPLLVRSDTGKTDLMRTE